MKNNKNSYIHTLYQMLNCMHSSDAFQEDKHHCTSCKEESIVGKGSFSCVFKGVLKDGTVVAVKRAIVSPNMQKNSKEFHTELDLLSRLNHAHLLNLLGYCEEGGERLLVYEFMAHGSLHQHLHATNQVLREQLDWIRRVTIAVQAARGIEYLHGYACPPVIHRDIKSSNILIDEEHNARVAMDDMEPRLVTCNHKCDKITSSNRSLVEHWFTLKP